MRIIKRISIIIFFVNLFCGFCFADTNAERILESFARESGLFVVIGCGDENAPGLAVSLGANGNSLVHAVAHNANELADFNKAIANARVKGCVVAEQLSLTTLPYRDNMVNVIVIMDSVASKGFGLTMTEVRRCLAPYGRLVICSKGKIKTIEEIPLPDGMDVWTHRYHAADGVPISSDKVFDLPIGLKWTTGLPLNFSNPKRAANRYSSTRAMVVDDGRCFTFSTGVYENLGDGWTSEYGVDQYLTCRDAFNGRFLWRKKIGDTYYGSLYIENLAPLVSSNTGLYLAGANGKMLVVDTKTGKTIREISTTFIPGVIAITDGIVVVATWKDGKVLGSVKRYDRRRMDWDLSQGTIEAYSDVSGKLLWKNDLFGTSMLIADGRVYIVSRLVPDEREKGRNKRPVGLSHPPQKVIAMSLSNGKVLWEAIDSSFKGNGNPLSLESAGDGVVFIKNGRRDAVFLSSVTGALLDASTTEKHSKKFIQFRQHICTPVMRVGNITPPDRRGFISKDGKKEVYAGSRAACLTGSVPAYGSAFIAPNWCRCSPGQVQGLTAVAPVGKLLTAAEMEVVIEPKFSSSYNEKNDATPDSMWMTFRGDAKRSSSSPCDIQRDVKVLWSKKIVSDDVKEGSIKRDWRDYLNTRLTAPVVSGDLAIVADIDHNEVIAFSIKDGVIAWRFMIGGRMNVAPTLYKGICLIADNLGYVTAVKVKSGELIYKLRIAPEEKRMLSYGKIESVWPIVGGVMIVDECAYVSAGRTQGSDGGLLIKAFSPETGNQIWAKSIQQQGNNVNTVKSCIINDAMIACGDLGLLMGRYLDLKTGVFSLDPVELIRLQASEEAAKSLGRPMKRLEKKALWSKLAQDVNWAGRGDKRIMLGVEGLHTWNWTRLGNRKFQYIRYGSSFGDTMSWLDKRVAGCNVKNILFISSLGLTDKGEALPKLVYRVPMNRQVTSLVVCNNVLLFGGAVLDGETEKGFIQALSLEDAKPVWDKTFNSKLSFNGLAVDSGKIIASFNNGTIVCLK